LYAQCLNILGLIYSGLEEPELVKQCQNLFQQSINYKKEVGDLDSIGESENAMGLFLRNTANRDFNKINEAIDHLKIALEIRKSIGNYRGAAQSCYTDRIAFIENVEEKEESYRLAKQSYLNGINYWNKRKGKPPIEELLEFKYRLGELEINQGNKKEGINILQEVQEERNRIGDWHNRARALDLLLKAYRGTNESKVTAHKIISIYQNVLADKTKLKQIYEEPVRFKNAKDFLGRIIKEVPECEGITSKILEDISKIFDDNRG
jgi:tetratricopeptide (TPR) repeat protein